MNLIQVNKVNFMSNIIKVHNKVFTEFETMGDLINIYLENGGLGVLGIENIDRLATVEGKRLIKGVRGFIITYGVKGGKAYLAESKAKSPSDFKVTHLTNYNYQVFTSEQFDQYFELQR